MIEREDREGIAWLRMTHGRANAWDVELVEALRRELAGAASAPAVVIAGTGRIFCAGVDLHRLLEGGAEYARRFLPLMGAFVRELFAHPAPVVAAVNGHAIAGGGILALASDYVVMADGEGRIGIPEQVVGVPFPAAALEVVRYAVPAERRRPLVNLGRTLRAGEALAWGLVDEVVEPARVEARAAEVAAAMAAIPAATFHLTKARLRAEALARMDEGAGYDASVVDVWSDPAVHRHIRDYLARVLGSSGRS